MRPIRPFWSRIGHRRVDCVTQARPCDGGRRIFLTMGGRKTAPRRKLQNRLVCTWCRCEFDRPHRHGRPPECCSQSHARMLRNMRRILRDQDVAALRRTSFWLDRETIFAALWTTFVARLRRMPLSPGSQFDQILVDVINMSAKPGRWDELASTAYEVLGEPVLDEHLRLSLYKSDESLAELQARVDELFDMDAMFEETQLVLDRHAPSAAAVLSRYRTQISLAQPDLASPTLAVAPDHAAPTQTGNAATPNGPLYEMIWSLTGQFDALVAALEPVVRAQEEQIRPGSPQDSVALMMAVALTASTLAILASQPDTSAIGEQIQRLVAAIERIAETSADFAKTGYVLDNDAHVGLSAPSGPTPQVI